MVALRVRRRSARAPFGAGTALASSVPFLAGVALIASGVPFLAGVALALASCGTASSAPRAQAVPPFTGEPTEHWFYDDLGPVDHEDVLPAFEASARAYGCSTQEIGRETSSNIHGEMRSYYGINAWCAEGSLALVTLTRGVRLGCAKPLTRATCDDLLRKISEAR